MAEPERDYVVPVGYKIKQKAVFHFEELYKSMYRWFDYYGYAWSELKYSNEVVQSGDKHVEIIWEGKKEINDYLSYVITVEFLMDFGDAQIDKGGVKIKTDAGTIELRCSAYIEKNVDFWEKKPMGKFMRRIYDNFLNKDRLNTEEYNLYIESHKLFNEVKAFLNLHSY